MLKPDHIGMNIDLALENIRRESPDVIVRITPTFDPKYRQAIRLSEMIVVREKWEKDFVELIVVSA